jgi:hypothetical protein
MPLADTLSDFECSDEAHFGGFLLWVINLFLQNAPIGNICVIYAIFSYILPVRETFLFGTYRLQLRCCFGTYRYLMQVYPFYLYKYLYIFMPVDVLFLHDFFF